MDKDGQGHSVEGWYGSPECDGCIDRDLTIAAMFLELELLHSQVSRLKNSMRGAVRIIGQELLTQ